MKTETKEPEEYFLIGQDDPGFPIYLRYQLFKALEDFAKREGTREQVGLLVGRVSTNAFGKDFILVEDAIESPVGDETTGRFDDSLWKRARRIAAARHPNRSVVGWFHTHPEGDLELVEEERSVHKRFFPEDKHLLYVISANAQDRNFYYRQEGELAPVKGFRIFGKTPANTGDVEPIVAITGAKREMNSVEASDEQQTRHLERNIEKIQKRLQDPPMRKKDYVIVGLLILNALLIAFRPNPATTVDTTALERGQSEISAQIGSVRGRIEKLERHLSELSLLDEQLKLAAGMEDIKDPDLTDSGEPTVAPTPKATNAGATNDSLSDGSGSIKLYKVVSGDILGVLVDKFYPEAPEGTFKSFAQFNRLKGPDFAIFPGDTLKVPNIEALRNR